MTVSGTTTSVSYTGDASTTSFAVTFPFLGTGSTSELTVVERTIATGAEVTKTYTTDYTVTGGSGNTGTVIAASAPAATVEWHLRRNTTTTQATDYVTNDPFAADTFELSLDRLAMSGQERDGDITQAFKYPDTYTGAGTTVVPEPSASKVLAWNSGATALENLTPNTDAYVTFPASSVDNTLPRFDGTGGVTIQTSGVTIDDNDLLSAPGGVAFDKGGDIASASPLVIDTDGGMFDVTGTTGFSAMTVAANRLFVLQFDGILTMTHGAGTLDLPGNANITTAAGDSIVCYSTAANVVRVLSITTAAGASASTTAEGVVEVATQAEVNTGTDALRSITPSTLAGSNFVNSHNYLLNGNFTVAQRGVSFTSATTPANSDDTYLLDQWILLSDGNDIVDVTQGTDAAVGNGIYLQADIETVEKKFGFLQVIPNKDSQNLLSESDVVSLSFNALVSNAAKLSRIKAMVLSWTSTADAVTSDIVSAWQSEGTSPTVVSNWTIEGDSGDLGVTASDVRYKLENVAINASGVNNIAVFIWSDDVGTNDTAGSLFKLTNVQLEVGPKATAFAPRPFQQELDLCQYWMERIYSSTSSNQWLATGYADNTSSGFFRVPFHVPKKAIPTITYSAAADFRVWYTGGSFQETTAAAVPGNPYHSLYHASLDFTTASASLTAGDAIALSNDGTADRWIEASSEL